MVIFTRLSGSWHLGFAVTTQRGHILKSVLSIMNHYFNESLWITISPILPLTLVP